MNGLPSITMYGNLVADPELRFTAAGVAVATFTVASTPRTFDKASNEWKDGQATFLRCTCWRAMAENIAESLAKGSRVLIAGALKQRSYEDKSTSKTSARACVTPRRRSRRQRAARVHRRRSPMTRGRYLSRNRRSDARIR